MPTSPTMTLHDCAEAFRANCISIAEETLALGIEEKLFPFAVPLKGKQSTRCPLIFRKKFYNWLAESLMQDDVVEI